MRDNMVAIRVFEKRYANGSAYDLVISELACREWANRCNAPTFVWFLNEDVDKIEEMLTVSGAIDLAAKTHLVGLVVKGEQIEDPQLVASKYNRLSQLFRLCSSYHTNGSSCRKARANGCVIKSYDSYTVNPKDTVGFGNKVIRFSTGIVNLK